MPEAIGPSMSRNFTLAERSNISRNLLLARVL
jgi:hypothetical protein